MFTVVNTWRLWLGLSALLLLVPIAVKEPGAALWLLGWVPVVTALSSLVRRSPRTWFGTTSVTGRAVLVFIGMAVGTVGLMAVPPAPAPAQGVPAASTPAVATWASSTTDGHAPSSPTPVPTPTPSETPSPVATPPANPVEQPTAAPATAIQPAAGLTAAPTAPAAPATTVKQTAAAPATQQAPATTVKAPATTQQAPATTAKAPATTVKAPATTSKAAGPFKNCTEAKAAGAAPLYRGQPGYKPELDGDGDGVACEK